MIYSEQTVTKRFNTYGPSGALADADPLPTAVLAVNGVDNAAVVTVTRLATGDYRASVTMPVLAVGDVADLLVTATVGGVARAAVVYTDVVGVSAPSVAAIAAGVWAASTRTLSSFGTLAADTATAVWGATVRTLSAFGFEVTISGTKQTLDALNDAPPVDLTAAEAALVKIQAAIYDPSTVEKINGEFWTRLSNNVLVRVDPEVGRSHGAE